MRYNNYKNDPLSVCSACTPLPNAVLAIASRDDLNPKYGTYPFPLLGQRNHGGVDMKLTSHELLEQLQFVAVSSPAYDDVPPFQWSKADFRDEVSHYGMPDLWNFEPVIYNWTIP